MAVDKEELFKKAEKYGISEKHIIGIIVLTYYMDRLREAGVVEDGPLELRDDGRALALEYVNGGFKCNLDIIAFFVMKYGPEDGEDRDDIFSLLVYINDTGIETVIKEIESTPR